MLTLDQIEKKAAWQAELHTMNRIDVLCQVRNASAQRLFPFATQIMERSNRFGTLICAALREQRTGERPAPDKLEAFYAGLYRPLPIPRDMVITPAIRRDRPSLFEPSTLR